MSRAGKCCSPESPQASLQTRSLLGPLGASWGRAGPAPLRPTGVRARPSGSGTGPEIDLHRPGTSSSLQHLEIRKAPSETSWELLPQSRRRSKCRGRSPGQARGAGPCLPGAVGSFAAPLPLPSLQLPGQKLQHRQESILLPFPSALKQCQTRLKAAKTGMRNQNKSRS